MFKPATKPTHSFIASIPELKYVLLRNHQTNGLELWTESRGLAPHSIKFQGVELEYVRDVIKACRVVDNDYNRTHCPNDIGRVYVDTFSNHAFVKDL